ncbi:hypothetical protein HYU11_06430 [Candidatus Woesearchaeota archaeon]|nr:hypothetical protein [Candidatus Woesearchaeota archaeon]
MLKRCLLFSILFSLTLSLVFAAGGTHSAGEVQGGVFKERSEYRVGSGGLLGSLYSTGGAISVQGENNQTDGIGVKGRSTGSGLSFGVYGEATTGNGVVGQSNSGIGLVGVSGSGYGVYGASTTGVSGYFDGNVSIQNMLLINGSVKGWGTSIINGRIWSANNNIHLSPPGGSNVIIDANYREAGGATGSVGLCLNGVCRTDWPSSAPETDPQVGAILGGRVPRWDGSALVTGTMIDNFGEVGIGSSIVRGLFNVVSTDSNRVAVNGSHYANNGVGVYGLANAWGGYGVQGIAQGSAAYGVYGRADGSQVAIRGFSNDGTGIEGEGETLGVVGRSTTGSGVAGSVGIPVANAVGMLGYAHPTANYVGVYGEGTDFAAYFSGIATINGVNDANVGVLQVRRGSRNSYIQITGPGGNQYSSRISVTQFQTGNPTTAISISNDNDVTFGHVGIGGDPEDAYMLYVNGAFAATSKSFVIDHPSKPGYQLAHGSLEGPENGVYYRGESHLSGGKAVVVLPDYFEDLTLQDGRTVLLTPKFEGNEQVSLLAASSVKQGRFSVRSVDNLNPSQRFYWEVKAVRKDIPPLVVEKAK